MRKCLVAFLIVLFIASGAAQTSTELPYDGLEFEYDMLYSFENLNQPSSSYQREYHQSYSFNETAEETEPKIGKKESIEAYNSDPILTGVDIYYQPILWINPEEVEVGETYTLNENFSFNVESTSYNYDSWDRYNESGIETIVLQGSTSSKVRNAGIDALDYSSEITAYFDKETGLGIRTITTREYRHSTPYTGDMYKEEEGDFALQYSNKDTDKDGISDMDEILKHDTDPTNSDTDNDGLSDQEEIKGETNPLEADTDGDGLKDGREQDLGTDPTERDTDNDGLNDQEELREETDPLKADTDEDGVEDGREVSQGSDPLEVDGDDDGLNDSRELELGSDPTSADTDGDGLDDSREVEVGSDPTVKDTDGDGVNDAAEVKAGLSPTKTDTDGDYLSDNIDPMPSSPLLPNSLAIILLIGTGYYFKSRKSDGSWNLLS
jgi:hypothetical protein